MPNRGAGTRRLIEWDGERCVPWAADRQMVLEHHHRYGWARELASGRRVLDLGCGEGFGAAILNETAASVLGVDASGQTVKHARSAYAFQGVRFETGSATDLNEYGDGTFGLVVAFELLPHVARHDRVIAAMRRVLAPDGVLVVSTPDGRRNRADGDIPVPFRERDTTHDELRDLLAERFAHVALFQQRGEVRRSLIEPLASDGPRHLIAVASDAPLPKLPETSALFEGDLDLPDPESARPDRSQHALVAEVTRASRRLREERIAAAEARADAADARAAEAAIRRELAVIHDSQSWQLFSRAQRRAERMLVGAGPLPRRLVTRAVAAFFRRRAAKESDSPLQVAVERPDERGPWIPLSLPRFDEPVASIVIPVYNGAQVTERCLHSVVRSTDGVPYEVIVVDDAADEDTKGFLAAVDGLTVVENERNLGYLRSVNRGVERARGRYVVLLNNDTDPQDGWLEALVARAESSPDVGAVAAKLVYPDGRLQEAGGIVWADGTPWNYGHGGDPGAPQFNYAREVDYGSAAALLVETALWREIGGFDERFAPCYFEDTDLCFAIRAAGRRVMYEPGASVFHLEGASMGTDTSVGLKRYQALNGPKFIEKWAYVLKEQEPDPSPERAYLASNRHRGPHALIVDHHVPMPDKDAGSLRMRHLIRNLLELGWHVSFLPDNGDGPEPYTGELQRLGVEVLAGSINLGAWLESAQRLELAVLSRPYVAPRWLHMVRVYAPGVRIAYDTVDLHYLRERRRLVIEGGADTGLADTFREIELALVRACDLTLVVSEVERRELLSEVPEAQIEIVPLANEVWTDTPGREGRKGLLFVGGFGHGPNVDAAVVLVREIMPLVWRELPGLRLTIVGPHPSAEVLNLASTRVKVAGWVPDLAPLLRESLAMVAPLRYGAGVKGKVTESMGAGLPVVTTTVGVEGLDVEDGHNVIVADEPEAIARRIVELHRDAELWARLSREGQQVVAAAAAPDVQRRVLERLAGVRDARQATPA